ncbi:hypothetical protein BDV93DRAFT_608025 [Ceratobasidium sp. AG-I]|nr:hypothetical protein BDV93DRAFT_608025 [Ceratobasidium sp. AG-I]
MPDALQIWVDARAHLSKAIRAYISAAEFLELTCTAFATTSLPEVLNVVNDNLNSMERDERDLRETQAGLKKKRNLYISPIYALPSELLATIFTAATAPHSPYGSSKDYVKKSLSRVCSLRRQVALDVCPVWNQLSLYLESEEGSVDKLGYTEIELHSATGGAIQASADLSVDNVLYYQAVLDTIAPYIKRLSRFRFLGENLEQFQPLLNLWLEKGVPESLTSLVLISKQAAPVFPETSSNLNNRLAQYIRHVEVLELFSVGLDWSTVAFDRIESLLLEDLPSTCCPTLMQLAQILSTCRTLRTISLERIQISTPLDMIATQPVELENLEYLLLKEVDIPKLLSIISSGRKELKLILGGVTNDTDTLETSGSFSRRANIETLTLTLPETRSNTALAQLLYFSICSIPSLEDLVLEDMVLRNCELNALVGHPLTRNAQNLSSVPIVATNKPSAIDSFVLRFCVIHATPAVFHQAVSALSWDRLNLSGCSHSFTAQGEGDSTTKALQSIHSGSEFGIQLKRLMPGQLDFGYV